MPLSAMRNIIQTGGQSIQQFATQTGERVRSVFRREKGRRREPRRRRAARRRAAERRRPHVASRSSSSARSRPSTSGRRSVDERIRTAVESLNPMAALEKEVRRPDPPAWPILKSALDSE